MLICSKSCAQISYPVAASDDLSLNRLAEKYESLETVTSVMPAVAAPLTMTAASTLRELLLANAAPGGQIDIGQDQGNHLTA